MRCGRLDLLAPGHASPVDALQHLGYGPSRSELVDGLATARLPVVVHDHDAAYRHAVVQLLQHVGGDRSQPAADAQQGDPLDGRVGQHHRQITHDEADAIVEQVEPVEALAHDVEIRQQVREPGSAAGYAGVVAHRRTGLARCRRGVARWAAAEGVGHPHGRAIQEMGVEVAPHEDGAAPASGPTLDQVAGYTVFADGVEAVLEVVEADPTHRGPWEVGEELGLGVVLGPQPSGVAGGAQHLGVAAQQADGVAQLQALGDRALLHVPQEQLDA